MSRFTIAATLHTYQPLYLKYRPQSLADLIGQSSVARTLSNAIESDRISHAYLFTGPRGTGKTSSARILAKSLNCQTGSTPTPCLICASCLEVKAGNSPSVFEIDAASNNSVDDARAIIERAPLVAQGGRYKLYIIDECHMLTKEAFNALLKTIEEPPPMVVFILATTEEHKVPPTIISRCQRLMFKLVNQADLSAHLKSIAALESINIDDEAIELIARRSGGGLRDALGLLDQAGLLSSPDKPVGVNDLLLLLGAVHEDALIEISAGVQKREGHAVLTTVNALMAEGREPAVLILELAKHFLNLTKASYVNDTAGSVTAESLASIVLGSGKYLQALVAQAKHFDRSELAQMVEYLDKLEQSCRRSSQPNLSLEMGLLALCHRHDITFVKELDQRLQVIEEVLGDEIERGPARGTGARPAASVPRTAPTVPARPASASPSAPPPPSSPQYAPPPPQSAPPQSVPQPSSPPQSAPYSVPSISGTPVALDAIVETEPRAAADDDLPSLTEVSSITLHEESPDAAESVTDPDQHSSPEQPSRKPPATAPTGTFDLDEFWSDVKDALQKRHIPTFSVVSTHAFPISFETENDVFVLGVPPNLQKTLENKLDHVKAACATVLERQINVRLKVVTEGQAPTATGARKPSPSPSPGPGPGPGPSPLPRPPMTGSPGSPSTEMPPQPRPKEPDSRPPTTSEADADEDERWEPNTSAQTSQFKSSPSVKAENGRSPSPPVNGKPTDSEPAQAERPQARAENRAVESGLIHEAYKLFQGPGSRLII